jgi:2-C-methyl-D-erythritol 4-phosphate cytidylyltransferase
LGKVIAVILAGGKGERFENNTPKQFIKLAGKPVIEYTIEAFNNHTLIDEIIIVSKIGYEDKLWEIVKNNNFNKVKKILIGGKERFDSTYVALKSLEDEDENTKILFHDAVRPLVDKETIDNVIKALDDYDAVDTAIDATDTIIEIDDNFIIKNIPNRKYMKRGQTPQGFRLKTIKNAYKKAIEENKRNFTCDCGVVHKMLDIPIKVVKSTIKNIKITYPIDLYIAEKYIQMGIEYDLENINLELLKDKNIVVFGNSSGIGKEIEKIAKQYGANVYGASRRTGIDIRDKDNIETFLSNIKDIDIIINTAAILIKKPLQFMNYEEIENIIDINYKGAVNIAYLSKKFLEKTNGMLINFASSSYTRGRANYALYSSSKAAIVNLTQALSEEWEDVKVNCILPQRTKTPMREKNFGYEDPETLLDPYEVAIKTLKLSLSNITGMILEIKK